MAKRTREMARRQFKQGGLRRLGGCWSDSEAIDGVLLVAESRIGHRGR